MAYFSSYLLSFGAKIAKICLTTKEAMKKFGYHDFTIEKRYA